MEGAQDMGGVEGFGPVRIETNEPIFHAEWERRAFAMTLAMATPGQWNIDMSRFARENRPHDDYLSKTYYEIWVAALERLLIERDLVSAEEIETGKPLLPVKDVPILTQDKVAGMLRRGGPSEREPRAPASFAIGDRVRTKTFAPPTHTRLPRYVRGRVGVVELIHGAHVFPDTNAMGGGENPEWLYTITFDGRALWGEDSDPTISCSVDAWESYLEPADVD